MKDWDLWGPLLVCCTLGITLHDDKTSNLFTLVFLLVFIGSLTVSLNTKLLGGTVSTLQSLCVLGYCLGPITLSLPVVRLLYLVIGSSPKFNFFLKLIVVALSCCWSCYWIGWVSEL